MQIMPIRLAQSYIPRSWTDPRIEVRASSIQGKGMFACKPIKKGEIVVIWGGQVFSEAEFKSGKARERSTVPIDDGLYLGSVYNDPENLDEYMNHSCDSNVWLKDEVTLIARRDIAKGEELTIDYALWEASSAWQMLCCCGSPLCRKLITGRDWKLPELQIRYQDHFSPYIAARIQNLNFTAKIYRK
jgi:hypothetical protein